MDTLIGYINTINNIVWGPAMLLLLAGTGLYLTFGLKLIPQRMWVIAVVGMATKFCEAATDKG